MARPLRTVDLTPALWPALERLFGANGACGGCWCMWWRRERSEQWADVKGALARRRMRALVLAGKAHGVLAFDGAEPVGWCAYGPRRDFARLDRAPSLACNDADRVWSLPCFFVRRDWRRRGVARALLDGALRSLRRRGARIAEGYPVKPLSSGRPLPAAFAWTGTRPLFAEAGFRAVGPRGGGKQRVRRNLR